MMEGRRLAVTSIEENHSESEEDISEEGHASSSNVFEYCNKKKINVNVISWNVTTQSNFENLPLTDIVLLQNVSKDQLKSLFEELRKKENSENYNWYCCGHEETSQSLKLNNNEWMIDKKLSNGDNVTTSVNILTKYLLQDKSKNTLEYLPIIYNNNKLKLIDNGVFWYSKEPSVNGKEEEKKEGKKENNNNNKPEPDLFIFNTHWDQGLEARRYSAAALRKEIMEYTIHYHHLTNDMLIVPTIVGGNFNSKVQSNSLNVLITGEDVGRNNNDIDMNIDSDDEDDEERHLLVPCHLSKDKLSFKENEDSEESLTGSDEEDDDDEEESAWYSGIAFEPTFIKKNKIKYAEEKEEEDSEEEENNDLKDNHVIDYIFTSANFKTLDYKVLNENEMIKKKENNNYHLPIYVSLSKRM
ncbi:hypothetical protein ABK040_006854 [Willaertia magna]